MAPQGTYLRSSLFAVLALLLFSGVVEGQGSSGGEVSHRGRGKVFRTPLDVINAELEKDETEEEEEPSAPPSQYYYGLEADEEMMKRQGAEEGMRDQAPPPDSQFLPPPMSRDPNSVKDGKTPWLNQNYWYYSGPTKHEDVDETMPSKELLAQGDSRALRHLQAGPARQLQACNFWTANGWWTSSSPPTPSCSYPGCAYCYTTSRASSYTSVTSYLYCNAGYTLSGAGTGVCYGYRIAYCSAWWGCSGGWWRRRCYCSYSSSCSGTYVTQSGVSGSCVQCNPAAITPWYANAPGWANGVATYTWTCRPGTWGNPTSRTCGSRGGWSGSDISCSMCSPPAAANAISPSVYVGQDTYQWTCASGFVGSAVWRTCNNRDGSWSGSPIVCIQCNAPSAPTDGWVRQLNSYQWQYGCNPGTFTPSGVALPTTRSCTVNGFDGTSITCQSCGIGYYCTGTSPRTICPAGTFGSVTDNRLTSAACSGRCQAGYYCPAGSMTPTAVACGAADRYCPPGSGTWSPVGAGQYSTPENVPINVRENIASCVTSPLVQSEQCISGVRQPRVVISGCNANGNWPNKLLASNTNTNDKIAVPIYFDTPSVQSAPLPITVSFLNVKPNAGCTWGTGNSGLFSADITQGTTPSTSFIQLKTGNLALRGDGCPTGYTFTLRVARTGSSSPYLFQDCNMEVLLLDENTPPYFQSGTCQALRSVPERSPVGTVVGSKIVALDNNKGQQMLYEIVENGDSDTSNDVPLAIEICSGQITVAQNVLNYGKDPFYDFTVKVKDTGQPQMETTCKVRVNVQDINDPPAPSTSVFSVKENTPPGTTSLGNIGPTDPDGGSVPLTVTVVRADVPDNFRFDSAGNIYVKNNALDFETKNRYVYKVEISDGVNRPQFDIVINLLNVNDAPTISGAQRTISENAAQNAPLSPANAITCSDQDGDAVTITLPRSPGAFMIGAGNLVVVNTSALVDFEASPTVSLIMTCTDAQGAASTASLDVTILDVAEPPKWKRAQTTGININIDETTANTSPVGTILGTFDATDPDRGTVLVYRLVTAQPQANLDWFKIDGLTGIVSLARALDFETLGTLSTTLTISVTDGTTTITIMPQFTVRDVNEPPVWGSSMSGSVFENCANDTTVATIPCTDPEGATATVTLDDSSMAEFYMASGNVLKVKYGLLLDKETTPTYKLPVTCTDPSGNKPTSNFMVTILDVQEKPVLQSYSFQVQELSPANTRIGVPVPAKDPDVGQKLTFSMVNPNPSVDWATIDPKTGQMNLLRATPEYATMTWFIVNVNVTDDHPTKPMWDSAEYNVSIVEATIRNNAPTVTLGSITLPESQALGALVDISRNASDSDNHPFIFSLQGADDLPFGISTATLTLTKALDFERDFAGFSFTVVVTDQPTPVNGTELLAMSASATLKVFVTDVNEVCSFPVDNVAIKLDENVPVNTQVGALLRANDPDNPTAKQREGITYTITAGNTGSVFQLVTNNDGNTTHTPTARLSVARASINFEVVNSYDLDITARDAGGLSCLMKVRITVNNLNDPPKISSVPTISVPETTAVGSNIGSPLTASDEDGNTIGWTIDPATNIGGAFFISGGGQLSIAKKLDFETRARYDLVVRADDGNGGQDAVTVVIQVQDQAEPPVYTGNTTFNVLEAQARGFVVFTASAKDEDTNDVLSYAITAGNVKDTLAINKGTGVVTVALPNEFDYELRTRFDLEVTVTDSFGLAIKVPVTINVLNVNEAPTIDTDFVEIFENSLNGTQSLQSISTSDPDGPADTVTLSITGGNFRSGVSGPLFSLRNNFIVVEAATLDFENAGNKTFLITITATDSGSTPPVRSTSKVIQVRALDKNEPPVFPAGQVRFVDENSPVGTAVGGPLVASDPDADQMLTFYLVDGPGDLLSIDGCTGTIKVNQPLLDFEKNSTYTLTVRVTDDGADKPGPAKLSAFQTVTVQIRDVNEACQINDIARTVQENSPPGTLLGAPLVANDPDFLAVITNWRRLSYALDINPRNLFAINSTTGQLSVGNAKNGFDFEDPDGTVITAVVKVTDGGGLSCSAKITTETTDINEPPVVFPGTRSTREATFKPDNPLKENAIIGAAVEAIDPDVNQTPLLSFSISRFWPDSATGFFGIVESGPSGGKLFLTDAGAANYSIDYETLRSITVLVNATDPYGLWGVGNVTVALIDQNENPSLLPTVRMVPENASVGAFVGSPIVATDPEKSALTYTITGGNSDGIFDIGVLDGQIRIKDKSKLNFEVTNSYTLSLQVEDNGQPGDGAKLTATSTVAVQVLDSNDFPTIAPQTFTIDENSIRGTSVASQVVADDEDVGDKGLLTYTIAAQDAGNPFNITSFGWLRVSAGNGTGSPVLNFEQKKTLFVTVNVTDPQGATAQAVMTVNLRDVPEDPFFRTPVYSFSVAKNAKFGTVIGTVQAFDEDAGDSLIYGLHRNPFNASDDSFQEEWATTPLFDVRPDGSVFVNQDTTKFLPLDKLLLYRAKATDSTGRVGICFFNITVVDSNDPPVPSFSGATREVRENSAANTTVGAPVICTDNDSKQTIRYAIISGNVDDMFGIDPLRAQLFVNNPKIDFEERKAYTLTLTCTDNGAGSLSATYTINVAVLDVNEVPWIAPSSAFTLDENSPVNTAVGSVDASDVDAADAGKLRFSFATATTFFQIIPATGAIVVSSPSLNFESIPTHRLTVRVTDVAGLFRDGSVVISLVNKNDQPTLPDAAFSVAENAFGAAVGKMAAQDEDLGQTFKYELTRPNDFCWPYTVSQPSMVGQLFTLPVSLPPVLNASSGFDRQLVSFRARAPATSSTTSFTVRLVLRATSAATSDRYELTVDSDGKGGLRRCTGAVCGVLFGGSTFNMPALSPRLFNSYWVSADRKTGTVAFGSYASGDRGAISYTALSVTDPAGAIDVQFVGVSANAVGTRVSSICFAHPTAASGGLFAINELTGDITTSNSLQIDYELQQVYGVEFKVTDQPGTGGNELLPFYLAEYGVATININDANERPTWAVSSCVDGLYLACLTVLENSFRGANVGQLPLAVDPDTLAKQTISYKLLLDNNMGASSAIFAVDAASAFVTVAQSGILNFEDRSSYVLSGVATDSGSPALSVSGEILVQIIDVCEPPSLSDVAFKIEENSPVGTPVGEPIVGKDPDFNTTAGGWGILNYTIVRATGSEMNAFAIHPTTGQLTVARNELDFETKDFYQVRIRTTDGCGFSADAWARITVTDRNEKPNITDTGFRTISEASLFPSQAGRAIYAEDPDRDTKLSWSVIGGTGADVFTVGACSGIVEIATRSVKLNYELKQNYTLLVMVEDSGSPRLNDTKWFTILIEDANDAPTIQDATGVVWENVPVGTPVNVSLVVDDEDFFARNAPWIDHDYSIVSGNDRGLFGIQRKTGKMFVAASQPGDFNFESAKDRRWTLVVRVQDNGNPPLRADSTVVITAEDVNEVPFFIDTVMTRSIDENTPRTPRSAGDAVGAKIQAGDVDTDHGSLLTFALVAGTPSQALQYFDVVPSGSNAGQLRVTAAGAAALDFETLKSYSLDVRVTDPGRVRTSDPLIALSATATYTIQINDRNEAPTCASASLSILENSPLKTPVGTPLNSTDPEKDLLSWFVSDGNDGGTFSIGANAQLSVADFRMLDFETRKSFTLTVTVRDAGAPEGAASALSSTCVVGVTILDVNEPPQLTPATFTLLENSLKGVQVASLADYAFDVDANDVLTYTIVSQDKNENNDSPFALDLNTGSLTVAPTATGATPKLDFEGKRTYMVVICVKDKGGLNATSTFTVNLGNVNEQVKWVGVPDRFYAPEYVAAPIGQALSNYVSDPDNGDAFTFTFDVPSGNVDSIFSINPADGRISVVRPESPFFKYNATSKLGEIFTLRVTVHDFQKDDPTRSGTSTSATTNVVVIVDGNNQPPKFNKTIYTFTLDENSLAGTVVARVTADDPDSKNGQKLSYQLDAAKNSVNRYFPFDVTTIPTTVAPFGGGSGEIVIKANNGVLDFEGLCKAQRENNFFEGVIVATDNADNKLSATAEIRINLRDVAEAPYFNDVTRVPKTGFFTFTVDENSPQGTKLIIDPKRSINEGSLGDATSGGGVKATDEDDACSPPSALRYRWKDNQANSDLFDLNDITGVIRVSAAGVGKLNFEAVSSYKLTVVARDPGDLTDEAEVTILLNDLNEAPTIGGLATMSSSAVINMLTVDETAPKGFMFGRVLATDSDAGAAGDRTWTLVDDLESTLFGIWPKNGTLYVKYDGELDWEDDDTFNPTVVVYDNGTPQLNATLTFPIRLNDVSDLRITKINLAPGEEAAGKGVDIVMPTDGSAPTGLASSHGTMSSLVITAGGTKVRLSGTNMGPTTRRLQSLGVQTSAIAVSATYGLSGTDYRATGCYIVDAYTQIECTTMAGVGVDQVWRVTISYPNSVIAGAVTALSQSSAMTGYLPPTIFSVVKSNPVGTPVNSLTQALSTSGLSSSGAKEFIVVNGTGFGPSGTALKLSWKAASAGTMSPTYVSTKCSHLVNHSLIMCESIPGVGKDLSFRIEIAGSSRQTSPWFTNTLVRYKEPSITNIQSESLETVGGQIITLIGSDFGPEGTQNIELRYSPGLNNSDGYTFSKDYPIYVSTKCDVDPAKPHTVVKCAAAAGVGNNHFAVITVAQQSSPASKQTIRYKTPVITDISGLGTNLAITEGGQQIIISGSQLGPLITQDMMDLSGWSTEAIKYLLPLVKYGSLPANVSATSFEAVSMLTYTAVSCSVTVAHRQIICLTAEGVGKDLFLGLVLGGQTMGLYNNKTLNYHPPILAYYSGPGSSNADTRGDEQVLIEGKNFGPLGTPVQRTTYGITGEELTATGCSVVIPHSRIICKTAVGAGAGLSWKVTIADQRSVAPTTSYAPPQIDSFDGPGAVDASTDGGDEIILRGRYFSVQSYLNRVTFGPSGNEFSAIGCRITQDHVEIRCTMPPGTGRMLRWIVSVGGQSSRPSEMATSYQAPKIFSITPFAGPTAGRVVFAVYGTGFALKLSPTLRQTRMNSIGIASPSTADMQDYWTKALAGLNPIDGVSRWISALTLLREDVGSAKSDNGNHTVYVALPEGYGVGRAFLLTVDGIPSNVLYFNYDPPFIRNAAPDRLNVPAGKLRVFLEGSSFCNGRMGCGRVLVQQTPGGAFIETPTLNYTHSQVVFIVEDPADGAARQAVIEVDGVRSNPIPFKKPVPNFLAGGQDPWEQMNTKGGDSFVIYDVRDVGTVPVGDMKISIGGRLCTDLQRQLDKEWCDTVGIVPALNPSGAESCRSYKLVAKTPAGIGRQLPIIVIVPGGQSREDKDFTFSYAPPVVNVIRDATDPSIIYSYDDSLITDPVGSTAFETKIAAKPGVDTVGAVVVLEGKNFGVPTLYINRTVEQPDRLLEIVDVAVVGQILEHDDERIKLRLPPGIGVNLLTKLAIAGQTTFDPVADKPNGSPRPQNRIAFRYKTPTLTSITPNTGVPTTGGAILTITGTNFGPLPSVGMRLTSEIGPAWNTTGSRAPLYRALQTTASTGGSSSPAVGSAGAALFGNYGISQGIGYKGGRSLPSITINGEPCKIPVDYPGKKDHTQLVCYAPEAEGQNLIVRVMVGDQVSQINPNVLFTYAAPRVFSISPVVGPTSGRDDNDRRIVMEIVGQNLGRNTSGIIRFDQPLVTSTTTVNGSTTVDPTLSSGSVTPVITALGDFQIKLEDVIFHNHTAMRFYMPEGAGENLLVRAIIGGQPSLAPPAVPGVFFSYSPPEVRSFRRYDRSEYECLPRRDPNPPRLADGRTVNRTLPAGCYRTMGGYPLLIAGKSFGPPQVRSSLLVTIGGEKANVEGHSHNMIIVNVPRGMGDANPIVVSIGARASATNNNTLFAYDPPTITNIAPNTPDALEGETVNIRGYNFGFKESPFELLVGGLPCLSADWLGDELMTCELGPTIVGNQNISLLIANRSEPVIFYETEEKVTTMCRRGSYGMSGEWCVDCETDVKSQGAVCPGKELYIDKVYSKPGFWRSNVTSPNPDCHELRQGREKCPLFLACSPITSCLGRNKCDEGYEGERCAFCLKGKYYRVDGECVKCPNNVWMIIIGFIMMGVGAAFGAWWLNKKNISLALFGIFLNYAQVLSIFGKLKIKWPPQLKELFKFLSAFAFNLDLAAPECLVPELNQVLKWVAFESIPLIAFTIFTMIYVFKWCYKYFCLSRKSKQLNTHLPQLISMGIIVMRVLYLQETKQALDVFNCQPTDPPDGKTYQSGNLDAPCYTAGSIQNTLWPMAAVAVTVYTIGFPTAALWWLRKNKYTVQLDQLLRAQYTGDDRKSNPYFTFRKTWKQLYQNMTVRNWFWEPFLMYVKGLLVFSSLMFRASPQYQMAVNIAILTVFIVFHMRRQPYLSSAQRKATLEDHQRKVFTSATHAKMEAELVDLYKRNKMGDKSKMGMTLDRLLRYRNTLQDRVVLAAFDYNTVETVLTAILILVNLGGVMLSSDRFVGARFAYNKDEYDAISGLIIFLIISGLLFWAIAFIFDLMIVLCPNSAKALMGGFSKKSKMLAASMNTSSKALGKAGASTRRMSIGPGASVAALAATAGDAGIGETSGMSHNPFLAARLSKASSSRASMVGGGAAVEEVNGAVKSIMSMQLPPDQEQWAAVKKVFESMNSTLGSLQNTMKEMNRTQMYAAKDAASEADNTSGASSLRTATIRSEFSPTLNSDSADQSGDNALLAVSRGKVPLRSAAASKQFGQTRAALAGYGSASSRRMLAFRTASGGASASIRHINNKGDGGDEITDSRTFANPLTAPISPQQAIPIHSGGASGRNMGGFSGDDGSEDSIAFSNPISAAAASSYGSDDADAPIAHNPMSTDNPIMFAQAQAASSKRIGANPRSSIAQRVKAMGAGEGEGAFNTLSPLAETSVAEEEDEADGKQGPM